jgi:uncharacterized membrane protein
MSEGSVTALLWLGFGGTHVGFAWAPVRRRLIAVLGELGYLLLYSAVAIVTFAALVRYVALHRFDEPYVSLLPTVPPVHGALLVVSAFGFALFIAGVVLYPRLPMAVFRHRAVPVRGIDQITRHPFFCGVALWAAAHALSSTSRVTFVFFVGFVVLSVVGAIHQDRRLVAEIGEPYRRYAAATSFWPFVALIAKRQKLRWHAQPWLAYGIGALAAFSVYQVHGQLLDRSGAYVVGVVFVGAVAAMLSSKARARQTGRDV